MKRLWFLKGSTGELLRNHKEEAREAGVPTVVTLEGSVAHIANSPGGWGFNITVRGNSRDRRQQARAIQRWLNQED